MTKDRLWDLYKTLYHFLFIFGMFGKGRDSSSLRRFTCLLMKTRIKAYLLNDENQITADTWLFIFQWIEKDFHFIQTFISPLLLCNIYHFKRFFADLVNHWVTDKQVINGRSVFHGLHVFLLVIRLLYCFLFHISQLLHKPGHIIEDLDKTFSFQVR